MNIKYLVISIKQTLSFFLSNNKYDFVLYSPTYFVVEKKHLHYEPLINFFKENNISFLYIEEPYKSKSKRSANAYYFDFIYVLIIFLRKFFFQADHIKVDKRIAKILRPFINIKYQNFITISQSMMSFFSELNNKSNIFDLQHGIIYKDKLSYLSNGSVSENIISNNVKVLLYSEKYKRILVDNEKGDYYLMNAIVVGNYTKKSIFKPKANTNICVSLQFTDSHSYEVNSIIYKSFVDTIKKNVDYKFFIIEHPRKNQFNISKLISLTNVKLVEEKKKYVIKKCAIHFTCYSTMAIDLAFLGIPTVFTNTNFSKKFIKDFDYPFNLNFNEILQNFEQISAQTRKWSHQYFSKHNYEKLIHFSNE